MDRFFEAPQKVYNDRLITALASVENDIEHWSQGHFSTRNACGTCFCIAGRAAALAFNLTDKDELDEAIWASYPCDAWDGDSSYGDFTIDYFGLSITDSNDLVHSDNTLGDLRRIVARITRR